jgi:hypothetical protein
MDALLRYVYNIESIEPRLIIAEPPSEVLLIWARADNIPTIAGLTLVYSKTKKAGNESKKIIKLKNLIDELDLNFLEIEYAEDLSQFNIDGKIYSNSEASKYIASYLGLELGSNPAKKPNDISQIRDPFHIWSRLVFDGINVRKVDIDALVFKKDFNSLKSIIEIKRSSKIKVGNWTPFVSKTGNTDYINYLLQMNLSKFMNCKFSTIHHEVLRGKFRDQDKMDIFELSANQIAESEIDSRLLNVFSDRKNRLIMSGEELKNIFRGKK